MDETRSATDGHGAPGLPALAALGAGAPRRLLAPGEALYEQGDVSGAPELYLVVDGLLLVEQRAPHGAERLLAVLGPGDLAGEVGALDPGPRGTRLVALVAAQVAVVSREALTAWLAAEPHAADEVLRTLARRVGRAEGELVDRAVLDTRSRLARVLVELADRWGSPGPEGVTLEHTLTQVQLARLTGCTRESVNKVLRTFARRGWVLAGHRRLVLLDVEALRRLTTPPPLPAGRA